MDRILIILKKENRSRASSALTLGLNTIILKHVYWYTYMQQISGERLQDHWSSGWLIPMIKFAATSRMYMIIKVFSNNISYCKYEYLNIFGAFLHDSCMCL